MHAHTCTNIETLTCVEATHVGNYGTIVHKHTQCKVLSPCQRSLTQLALAHAVTVRLDANGAILASNKM